MNRASCTVCLTLVFAISSSLAVVSADLSEDYPSPGTTHLRDSTVTVEMNLDTGRPMIDLMVNGKGPFRFVVDTGAGLSVIDRGIAGELGLEVVGEQVLHSPGTSEGVKGDRVQVDWLEAGGLRIDRPVLATMDLVAFSAGTIEGVLGRPHFRELLLTFDYPASQLVVARGSLDRSDSAVIAFDDGAGSLRFPVDVSGVSVPMVLDTGSPGGFVLPKALESRFKFRSALQQGPTIQLVGGAHPTWQASLDGTIRLAEESYENPNVKLTTISDEFGNIGFSVLRELRVTVDQANKLLRFQRVAQREMAPRPRAVEEGGMIVRRAGPRALGGPGARPRMGIAFDMTPAGFVQQDGGLIVRQVDAQGPADRAGLKVGDIVLAVGGEAIAQVEGMAATIELLRGSRPLAMELLRGDERLSISID